MTEAIANRARAVRADSSQGKGLRFVPILGESDDRPPYALLSKETLSQVTISETSAAGSVPELVVRNGLDVRLFLMDGQELVGAKQNRILNTDVLVPAAASLTIPVSCVEQGRWHHVSPSFSGGKAASHRVRSGKLQRVHDSLRTRQRHDANQGAVWQEVEQSIDIAGAASPTMALSDAYASRQRELSELRAQLRIPEQAVGLAVFHGGKLQGLDLFDRHATLKCFWESLVDSYAIDLMAQPQQEQSERPDEAGAVQSVLTRAALGTWEPFASPGEGQDWRLGDQLLSGSALVWEDQTVIHLQLFPRRAGSSGDETTTPRRPRLQRRYWPRE